MLGKLNLAAPAHHAMDPPITVSQMYDIENRGHDMGFLKKFMMENAGAAAARRLVEAVRAGGHDMAGKRVLVAAGLGNNGGDGMVVARHLAGHGARPAVHLLGGPDMIKTEESRWNWSLLERMPGSVSLVACGAGFVPPSSTPDVLVDAIFGTGITGDIREPYSSAIAYINEQQGPFKMAVDVPSGLDPQTGETANMHTACDMTVTFHRMKQGIPRRPDLTGALHTEKIGIPPEAEAGIVS